MANNFFMKNYYTNSLKAFSPDDMWTTLVNLYSPNIDKTDPTYTHKIKKTKKCIRVNSVATKHVWTQSI